MYALFTVVAKSVTKKLTSVKPAKPNAQMYVSILIAMVGAMMFGLDQLVMCKTYESFQRHWCDDKYEDATTCHSPGVDENQEWLEGFILWAGLGAAAGALRLAPVLPSNWHWRIYLLLWVLTCPLSHL